MIQRELLLPVSFALLVRPGTPLEQVKTVASHPVAEPQCRRWLGRHLPDARWETAASNAEAGRQVRDGAFDGALAGAFTAARYGLEALAEGIEDNAGAQTRFVVVTRPGRPPARSGRHPAPGRGGLRGRVPVAHPAPGPARRPVPRVPGPAAAGRRGRPASRSARPATGPPAG